jgi:hypothetical protein
MLAGAIEKKIRKVCASHSFWHHCALHSDLTINFYCAVSCVELRKRLTAPFADCHSHVGDSSCCIRESLLAGIYEQQTALVTYNDFELPLVLILSPRSLLQAASEIGADSIVMDCEDGVAINMKDVARQTIALMLDGEPQAQ